MEWRKITAIFRVDKLEEVERRLRELGVRGISVTRGKGYGEYANFFTRDWCVTHARVEVFNTASRAEEIARAIMDAAHTGIAGDGIVAILPVERIYRIRTKAEARTGEI
ncbi:MAG: P-II family nitrogen regulator [Desulfobacteria bacterium]|jgi:nitrogen regulatory protein P-II 1